MSNDNWTHIIRSKSGWFDLQLSQVWEYRDLIILFVKRDFTSVYRQTILGPIWFFIQPILTTFIFTVVFQNIARIGTDSTPPVLFYLSGITLWTYFADCLNKTSSTFVSNAGIFGKVYFPRLVVPLSMLISNLFKLGIQLLLFLSVWGYYVFVRDAISPNYLLFPIIPLLILLMAGFGFGFGILISALTTKYRDLVFLVGFGVQLLMYATPVVYPLSVVPERYKGVLLLNPLTSVVEAFRGVFLGTGLIHWSYIFYGFCVMTLLLLVSVIVFNKVDKSFMDTV